MSNFYDRSKQTKRWIEIGRRRLWFSAIYIDWLSLPN